MEDISTPPIIESTPAPASTSLPPGVSVAGSSAPAAAPAPAPVSAATPPVATSSPSASAGEINWLRVLGGVVIVTGLCYSIWYFRYKTRQYSESVKEQDKQIAANTADIDYLLNPEQ